MRNLFVFLLLIIFNDLFGQTTVQAVNCGYGVRVTVDEMMSLPQKGDDAFTLPIEKEESRPVFPKTMNPLSPEVPYFPFVAGSRTPSTFTPTVSTNFVGVTTAEGGGYYPPDCTGEVGPSQILVSSNGRIKVFDKSGVLGALNMSTNAFFTGALPSSNASDPHIRFDPLSQRWFVCAISTTQTKNNYFMLAVSSGPTITGSSSFTYFSFRPGIIHPADTTFFDYPTLGVDADGIYVGANMFTSTTGTFARCNAYVIQKSSVLGAGPMMTSVLRDVGTTTGGMYTPQGVDNDYSGGTGYFVGSDISTYGRLRLVKVTNASTTSPTFSANFTITVPSTFNPISQVCNCTSPMNSLDHRMFAAMIDENGSIWAAHNIKVNATGVGSAGGDRNGARWYVVNPSTPSLATSGTVFDNVASGPRGYVIPSIAANGQGNAVIGYSTASAATFPNAGFSGRAFNDPVGTMSPFVLATNSTTGNSTTRWGDYSQVCVDPTDNMSFWSFQEFSYQSGSPNWGLQVTKILAPPPSDINTIASVSCSASAIVNIVGTSTNGSGFYDGGSGTNNITATVGGGGVVVNSLLYTDPTHLTLNLNTLSATPGTKTLTITNPDGQFVTKTFDITPCVPFTIELVKFNVYLDKNKVALQWVTINEQNFDYFIIEKSNDGKQYQILKNYEAKGNSLDATYYDLMDSNPKTGDNYYRLKMVNKDGTFKYSNIVNIYFKGNEDFFAYPQLVNYQLNIVFNSEVEEEGELSIHDINGKIVANKSIICIEGPNKIQYEVGNLSLGTYFITLKNQNIIHTSKFTKIY
jgi:hypothetical protein